MSESWLERWREGRIGWHEEGGNASLQRHWSAGGRRVLVPMCGKTVDMLWLEERGNEVVGVELSDIAVRAFFEENALRYTIRQGPLPAYVADERDITIYCGDLFDLDEPGHTGCLCRNHGRSRCGGGVQGRRSRRSGQGRLPSGGR